MVSLPTSVLLVFLCQFFLCKGATFDFALQQVLGTTYRLVQQGTLGKQFPSNSVDVEGKWATVGSGAWTSGFYPGLLWQLWGITNSPSLRDYAEIATEGMKKEQHNTGTHDVGFMIFCSFGTGYNLTKDSEYLEVILTAAKSLSTRFSSVVGCIRSWNGPNFEVIIDNMMNLELLWWAAANGGSKEYFDMAVSHSDNMIRDCIKPDGSSYHLVVYDPTDGRVLNQTNSPQGYPNGVWSRGEAWALYGFTKSYHYSKYPRYLKIAMKVADYFLSRLPSDSVPFWDFNYPDRLPFRDTSAAAVAASGLILLSDICPPSLSEKYFKAAKTILESLKKNYLGEGSKTDAILLHGYIGYETHPSDLSLIYGDYYYVEALNRLVQHNKTKFFQ